MKRLLLAPAALALFVAPAFADGMGMGCANKVYSAQAPQQTEMPVETAALPQSTPESAPLDSEIVLSELLVDPAAAKTAQ